MECIPEWSAFQNGQECAFPFQQMGPRKKISRRTRGRYTIAQNTAIFEFHHLMSSCSMIYLYVVVVHRNFYDERRKNFAIARVTTLCMQPQQGAQPPQKDLLRR